MKSPSKRHAKSEAPKDLWIDPHFCRPRSAVSNCPVVGWSRFIRADLADAKLNRLTASVAAHILILVARSLQDGNCHVAVGAWEERDIKRLEEAARFLRARRKGQIDPKPTRPKKKAGRVAPGL